MAKTLKVQLQEAQDRIAELEKERDAALADASPEDVARQQAFETAEQRVIVLEIESAKTGAKIDELSEELGAEQDAHNLAKSEIADLEGHNALLRAKYAELEAEIASLKAPAFSPVGSILADGVLFLGGRALSDGWRSEHQTSSIWYLDFSGPDAERVARVARGAGEVAQLGPDLWRTTQPNAQYATITVNQVRTNIAQQELKCEVVGYPKNCSRAQGLDASRLTGIGAVTNGLAARAGTVKVSAKYDADGKATELLLKL
jgi:hypothetical protein